MSRKSVRKVTIKDVAQACGISTQTVSRVINQRPDVAPETRELVERTIAALGYQPSALARSLVRQRSYTLGVIIAGLKYVGVSQTLNGIAEESEQAGYSLLLKELPRFDTPNIVPVIESLMAHHVEGIVFAGPEWNENVKVAQSQLPVSCPPIVFLKCQPNPNYTTISIDNYGGARMAVEHLLQAGRRHIGLIAGPLEWLEARQRKQGWEDALTSAGISLAPYKWTQGNWNSASGEAAFAELKTKYPRMDAVFASNDQMALGVLHYAHLNGIRIPDDVAVVGFDNLAESAYFTPSLTTIEQPLRELGRLSVRTLLEQVNAAGQALAPRTIVLPTRLVVRQSTPVVSG